MSNCEFLLIMENSLISECSQFVLHWQNVCQQSNREAGKKGCYRQVMDLNATPNSYFLSKLVLRVVETVIQRLKPTN